MEFIRKDNYFIKLSFLVYDMYKFFWIYEVAK